MARPKIEGKTQWEWIVEFALRKPAMSIALITDKLAQMGFENPKQGYVRKVISLERSRGTPITKGNRKERFGPATTLNSIKSDVKRLLWENRGKEKTALIAYIKARIPEMTEEKILGIASEMRSANVPLPQIKDPLKITEEHKKKFEELLPDIRNTARWVALGLPEHMREDFISAATEQALKAIARYDPEKKKGGRQAANIKTYVRHTIMNSRRQFMSESISQLAGLPKTTVELSLKAKRIHLQSIESGAPKTLEQSAKEALAPYKKLHPETKYRPKEIAACSRAIDSAMRTLRFNDDLHSPSARKYRDGRMVLGKRRR